MKEIVFIGSNFYRDSRSFMSPIYEVVEGGYKRFDWGFLEIALQKGENVFIRQATKDEVSHFKKQLSYLKNKMAKWDSPKGEKAGKLGEK